MNMQIQGKIHAAFDAAQVTDRFRKREFVLELEAASRYPQYVMFQLTGDRCDSLDGFEPGHEVAVEFSLRGREWTSPKGEVRFFNSLEVWSIDRVGDEESSSSGEAFSSGEASSAGGGATGGTTGSAGPSDDPPPPTDDDDIPF
jgi:single-strand DNA-binding protein